jgi:hypothetical protein
MLRLMFTVAVTKNTSAIILSMSLTHLGPPFKRWPLTLPFGSATSQSEYRRKQSFAQRA